MPRFHIDIHDKPVKCPAQKKCRAKGGPVDSNGEVEHFEGTLEEARAWAEEKNAEATGGIFGKNTVKTSAEQVSLNESIAIQERKVSEAESALSEAEEEVSRMQGNSDYDSGDRQDALNHREKMKQDLEQKQQELENKVEQLGSIDSKANDEDSLDTTKVHYGGIEEVPEWITRSNATSGAKDTKEVKRNEKTGLSQVNYGGINPAPEVPVVKKRKDRKTGYRDTTVYSPDGKRFVTIRAHDENPEKSYAIDGSGEGEPYPVNFYNMPSSVSRIDDYARELQGAEKSHKQKEREAREEMDRRRDNLAVEEVSLSIDKYTRLSGEKNKDRISGVHSVKTDEADGINTSTISFYDGSEVRIEQPTDSSSSEKPSFYYVENGEKSQKRTIDNSSAANLRSEMAEKEHSSRALAEYDDNAKKVKSFVSEKYPDFKVSTDNEAYPANDGGNDRLITIRGKNNSIVLVQKNNRNIEGTRDVMYDVSSDEDYYRDGGIYMKGDTRTDKLNQLSRYLDALEKKDKDPNGKSKNIHDYM